MECIRRIAGNDTPEKPYVNQTSEITNAKFVYADGVSTIQNKTTSTRNVFTYADGTAISGTNTASAAEWLSLKANDVITIILYDIHVTTAGTDIYELYLKDGTFYRNIGSAILTANDNYVVLQRSMLSDGVISGIHHNVTNKMNYSYRWKIYVNGIRVA